MYEYRYAVGRYRDYQPGYHIVDIADIKLSDVAKYFTLLDIVVYDDVYKRLLRITLDDYFDNFMNSSKTIVQFLADNGSNVLTYYTDYPLNEYQYGKWLSMTHQGLFVYPGNVNLANDRQDKLTADAAPDIRLVMAGVDYKDYKKLVDYSLYIVNGCFVRAWANSNAIFLLGAGDDYKAVRKDVYASAISFENIGKVQTIPITKDMVSISTSEASNRFLINLDQNINLDGKTLWMVFNGQICVDQEVISNIGSNILEFCPDYINMTQHYMAYKEYTRTPSWKLQSKINDYVQEALVMHNSFIVLIDSPTVGVEVTPLLTFKWPSGAITDSFEHPIMIENGLFPYTYRRQYEFDKRLVNLDIHHIYYPLVNTVGDLGGDGLYDTINQGDMGEVAKAYEFKITGVKYE